jgi:DNA repair protein RadC
MDFDVITKDTFVLKEMKVQAYRKKMNAHKVHSSQDVFQYIKKLRDALSHEDYVESFYIVVLSRANNIIGWKRISVGGTAGTVVDVKLVAKFVLETVGSGVILIHNHPSGNLNPSKADVQITKQIQNCFQPFKIPVLDHLIISDDYETNDSYHSFADEGML